MLKIFIPSYRRASNTTTPALLDKFGIPYKLIVRESEYVDYSKQFSKRNLIVIGNDDGLNVARERVRKTLSKNEWCLQMDDNVRGFTQCIKKFYKKNDKVILSPEESMITWAKWKHIMCENVSFKEFYDLAVTDTLEECEKRGAWLAGFSAIDNPAFRGKKYIDVGYVCGKVMLMRKQKLKWNQSSQSSGEDYALTGAHLYENGRVLINKWAHPKRVHYQPGGCGTYLDRLPYMLAAQKELRERYGNLFGIKNENKPDKKQGELRIRFTSLTQVAKWRSEIFDPNWR